jgi:hypothetical protein
LNKLDNNLWQSKILKIFGVAFMLLHLIYFVVWIYFILFWLSKFYLKRVLENRLLKKRKKKREKQFTFLPVGRRWKRWPGFFFLSWIE